MSASFSRIISPTRTRIRINTNEHEEETEQLLSSEDIFLTELQPQSSNVISRKRIITWLLVSIVEPLYCFQAFPYLPQFIQETKAFGGNPASVGYAMGLVETTYYATGAMLVLHWARLSDRIGRKPVLLFSLVGIALAAACLGLSVKYQTIVLSRAFLGGLNASDAVLRSSMGDVLVEKNLAKMIVWLPAVACIAAICGPLIGGSLARPYEMFPNTFGKIELWKTFPYLLPNLVILGIIVIIFIVVYIYFEETLPKLQTNQPPMEAYDLQESEYGASKPAASTMSIKSLLNPRLILLLLANMIGTLLDGSFGTVFSVIIAMPVETGGFGLSSSEMGVVLAFLGTFSGILIVLGFPRLHALLGSKNLLCLGMCGFIGTFAVIAVAQSLNHTGSMFIRWIALSLVCISNTLAMMVPNCFTLLLANGVRADSLGAVNGLAQSTGSITRAMGPFIGGTLLTLSLEKRYLGDGNLVYYVLSGIALFGLFIARFIPSTPTELEQVEADS